MSLPDYVDLVRFNNNSYYFPAYEIMTDELRDYRNYDASMTHPSFEAIQFIIAKFFNTFLDPKDQVFQKKWLQILTFLNHKSENTDLKVYLNENLAIKK